MIDELARVRSLMGALARREQALLIWQTVFRAAGLGAVGLAVAAWAVWRDVPRPQAAGVLVLVVGLGAWFALALPLLRRWRAAGDALRQARLVEARDPAFRGRLVTAVAHDGGTRGTESPALLALVASRAYALATPHAPHLVHPIRPVRRGATWALAAWVLAFGALLQAPGGPGSVWGFWTAGAELGASRLAGLGGADGAASARVGDLTLRYLYPDYTGLEPYEVVNSTGEALAPPGTRVIVSARSAEVVEGASLVAYEQPALDATVTEGRAIEASFVVQIEPGNYRILTHQGGDTRASAAFPIVPDPDLPPEVSLDADRDIVEVPVDEPLAFGWTASDDYGIARVDLEVDGKVVGTPLRVPRGRDAETSDRFAKRPMDLGMFPGGTYEVAVVATDNDTVSGAKVGRSNVLRVTVLGEDGIARLTEEKRRELLDVLVDLVGDHLEESFPPGRTAGAYARWGETVNTRYAPLQAFLEEFRSPRSDNPIWPPVVRAIEDGLDLIRYSQVSFLPRDTSPANAGSVDAVRGFREEAILGAETAALHVDAFLKYAAMSQVAREVGALADEALDVSAALASEELDPLELLMTADGIDARVAYLRELAKDLPRGGMRELIEMRSDEVDRQLDQARAAMRASDADETRRMMERVADRLQEASDAIQAELDRRRRRQREGESKVAELEEALEEIIATEDALAAQVQGIRERDGEGYREQIRAMWERLEAQALEVESSLQRFDRIEADGRSFDEQVMVDEAVDRGDAVVDAAVARDLTGLRAQAIDLNAHWVLFARRHMDNVRRSLGRRRAATGEIRVVVRQIETLMELMEVLRRRADEGDPELRSLVQALEADQAKITRSLDQAQDLATEVAQEMPVTPRGLEPALDDAEDRMEQAEDQLGVGDGMQAEGSQRAAIQHVEEALEALRQAAAEGAAQANEMEEPKGGQDEGDGEQGRDRPGEELTNQDYELPEPEDFTTPEAYRAALLRGMEEDVPEEYRALKRRYYEELVRQ